MKITNPFRRNRGSTKHAAVDSVTATGDTTESRLYFNLVDGRHVCVDMNETELNGLVHQLQLRQKFLRQMKDDEVSA